MLVTVRLVSPIMAVGVPPPLKDIDKVAGALKVELVLSRLRLKPGSASSIGIVIVLVAAV